VKPLGAAFDNLSIGIAVSAGMGVAIGAMLNNKNRRNIKPEEKENK